MDNLFSFNDLINFSIEENKDKIFIRIDNNEYLGYFHMSYPNTCKHISEARVNDGLIEFLLENKEKNYERITKYYGSDFKDKSLKLFKEIKNI
jgi:hypothetical protein